MILCIYILKVSITHGSMFKLQRNNKNNYIVIQRKKTKKIENAYK